MKASETLAYVSRNFTDITAEEIGRCHKVYDCQAGLWFYLVENSRGLYDAHGIIEYPVRYGEHGFTCGCPSGQTGFANIKHPSGVCKHVRAAIAAAIEERTALAAMAQKIEDERRACEEPIEVKWNIPAWMLQKPVAPHMRKAPRER